MTTHAEVMAELERQKAVLAAAGPLGWTTQYEGEGVMDSDHDWVAIETNPADAALIVQAVNREADRLAVARELLTEHGKGDASYRDDFCGGCPDYLIDLYKCAPYLMGVRLVMGGAR